MTTEPSPRLTRLLGFLAKDPQNRSLREDAVSTSISERQFELAERLITEAPELSSVLLNQEAVVFLALGRFDEAATILDQLIEAGNDSAAIRFNLAWAKAMLGDFAAAHELLDDDAIAASPKGPALKIQAMHHLELYEDALAVGQGLAEKYPDNLALMGALATLAMDAEDVALSRHYAELAGDDPQGLAVLGLLTLEDQDPAASLPLFEKAIAQQPRNPRAWVGKGLGLMAQGQMAESASALDQGAALFEDHLGSWIASGWAHYLGGNPVQARASFERALAIDSNFAETHGALAVMELSEGNVEQAQHHCTVALRLDRNCLGGALAKSLLMEQEGNVAGAQKIRELAMWIPISADGKTLGQAIVAMTSGMRR